MEVLNAARLSPVSIQKLPGFAPERKADSKKHIPFKFPHTSLALVSSILSAGSAKSLTYQEALGLSVDASGGSDIPEIDFGGIFDGILSFGSENPLLLGGGVFVLAVPLILSQVFKSSPKAWGIISARAAFAKLSEDSAAQLLDIRGLKDFKEVGTPDLRNIKKKAVSIPYGDDNPSFLKKLALKFKDPGNVTLFVLDK